MQTEASPAETADVVVVGAGLAGLVAARHLRRAERRVVLLERRDRPGGRVHTEYRPGAYLENGGIFHTKGYPALRALLDELGLADNAATAPGGFRAAVHRGGARHVVDFGSLLAPLRFGALGLRDQLSLLRVALPALLARPGDLGDLTSLARFDTGSAADGLTRAAAGYFTAVPHEFLWGVRTRELSRAMLALQLHAFRGELLELRGGMGLLVDRLVEGLDARYDTEVHAVEQDAEGVTLHTGEGRTRARGAVLACPADDAVRMWPDAPRAVREHLTTIDYSRIDYVYLRTRRPLGVRIDGEEIGMEIVPAEEVGEGVLGGIYFADSWAEDGGLLLVSATAGAGAAGMGDDELADRLQSEAEGLYPELTGQVTDRVLIRHDHYTPTFAPGSVKRLAAARRELPSGRIDLAGDHMTAPWVEGAVRSGDMAADRLDPVVEREAAAV